MAVQGFRFKRPESILFTWFMDFRRILKGGKFKHRFVLLYKPLNNMMKVDTWERIISSDSITYLWITGGLYFTPCNPMILKGNLGVLSEWTPR